MLESITLKVPNFLTISRIILAILTIFTKLFSVKFYIIYSFCGITDVLDGYFARKLHIESNKGAILDSIADLIFYGILLIMIIPFLIKVLPLIIWIIISIVILGRIFVYFIGLIKFKTFVSTHSYLNKLTGFLVFSIPYFIYFWPAVIICSIICAISFFACLEELVQLLVLKEYIPGRKSIFIK